MSDTKYLLYRGDVKSATGTGGTLLFTTVHPEGQPTAIFRLDVDKVLEGRGDVSALLQQYPLPCGGLALATNGEDVWAAGTDQQLYRAPLKKGLPKALGDKFPAAVSAAIPVSKERLALLAGSEVYIVERKEGKVLQKLDLTEPGTCLAADPSGQWLAAGTNKGTVATFECEDKDKFAPGDASRIHEGAVTAILFEPEELRFFSGGADRKLLSTHARGKLEPEDKGRGNNHTEPITSMAFGPADRLFTASFDRTIKSWPRVGHVKPATFKDNVGKVVVFVPVTLGKRTHLIAACDDNTFRLFPVDDEGKLEDLSLQIEDAYARARAELNQDVGRRESALKVLAEYQDAASLEMIARQVKGDGDHGLRLLAIQLLGKSTHPRAAKHLEEALRHGDEAVRLAALEGLRRQLGAKELRPLDLALRTEKADVGVAAVQALVELAPKDDQALARLTEALDSKTADVRQAALAGLEKVFDAQSPEANLLALGSQHADLRRQGLLRLYQRKLLQPERVQTALRWRGEDQDPEVRRTAFLLALHTRPRLVQTLSERDAGLRRQLNELEAAAEGKKKGKGKAAAEESTESDPALAKVAGQIQTIAKRPQKSTGPVKLDPADYEPLLQATASRALDTCLRGARGLAVLGDVRAFGLLLQLSREESKQARVEVCQALAALDDERSINRLRSLLYDPEPPVRDAAFTALAHIHDDQPLLAAEAGLSSAHEDVRRRGLQVLLQFVKKHPPKTSADATWRLFLRALNDVYQSVRSEATKAALNNKIAGGGIHTLRYLLQSIHADVRREVLTEVMAQVNEDWAWNLILEFYNDADPKLREEAFQFATQKTKELAPLERAMLSQYADVRKLAVQALAKKHTREAQKLLTEVLTDSDKEIRQLALGALVSEDARAALEVALTSSHADVRVRAATALARQGSKAALMPLLSLATAPEPERPERKAEWAALAEQALEGLAELAHPGALTDLLPLLISQQPNLRKLAARALVWCSRPDALEPLRSALQHDDPQVKFQAALGLAYGGDPLAASLVFSRDAVQNLTAEERLAAALTLGPAGEDQLIVLLDDENENLRKQALILLMLLELGAGQGTPGRSLAALSSRMPRVRLTAARALENFSAADKFRAFVVELVNDRGEEQAWTIPPATISTLAELMALADPHLRARTALLLKHFLPKEQAAWNQAWAVFEKRYAGEIQAVKDQAQHRAAVPAPYNQEQLQEVAFGAYVGLVREQGGAQEAGNRPSLGAHVVRIRQAALNRLLSLAQASPHYRAAALPVFIHALADPNQPVRMQALEQLQELGMDRNSLGAEALEAGHLDLGVKGLELLSAGALSAEGQAALQQVLLTRNDALAIEAAKLLLPQRGQVAVAVLGLEAKFEDMRKQSIAWLVLDYDANPQAQEKLRQALQSRYPKVRNQVALALAGKKDLAAYPALVELLNRQEDPERQQRIITALEQLGDPRTPDAFLDRLENDPGGTAQTDELLKATGRFRRPENASRLLALAEHQPKWRKEALDAVLTISGYDQRIDDLEDEKPDKTWLEKQHPRHAAVLARLMDTCFSLGETKLFQQLIASARWARGKEVEPILVLLLNHPDDTLRNRAVEALGWRLRKRAGSIEPLRKALQHRHPETQFLAAEGLAKGGKAEGLSILLASIDFQSDFNLRRRSVMALGELADARSLDVLLKLANEDGHALQESAAESLGHMSRAREADDIFKILERLARDPRQGLAMAAIRGLRWFNTRAGWQIVRERAQDPMFNGRGVALDMLGSNDDPATRDVLLKLLAKHRDWTFEATLTSARRLWGEEALEPDLAVVQNPMLQHPNAVNQEPFTTPLKRVTERAAAADVFRILPRCMPPVQDALAASLLQRQPPPLAEARAALASADVRACEVAARLLGRAGKEAADCERDLAAALVRWRAEWHKLRNRALHGDKSQDALLDRIGKCLQSLLWAAGRIGVAQPAVLETAQAYPEDVAYRPIRRQAVTALGSYDQLEDSALKALQQIAVGTDPESRTAAADVLARLAPQQAGQIAEQLLSDRISFNHLASRPEVLVHDALQKAARQVHYQGVALPQLIARADVDTLAAVVEMRNLPEATRLGAMEGLAMIASDAALERLAAIGKAGDEPDEIRKAAWRALRRARRQRGEGSKRKAKKGATVKT